MNKNISTPAGIIIIVAIAIFTAGVVAWQSGWITKLTNQIIATPTPTSIPDETANWETYRNNEYGFEIKYPSGAEIKKEKNPYNMINYGTDISFSMPNLGKQMIIHIGSDLRTLLSPEYGGPPDMFAGEPMKYQSSPDFPDMDNILTENVIINDVPFHRDYYIDYGGMGSSNERIIAYVKNPHNGNYISMGVIYSYNYGTIISNGTIVRAKTPDSLLQDTPGCIDGWRPGCWSAPEINKWLVEQIKKEEKERMFDQMLSTFRFVE